MSNKTAEELFEEYSKKYREMDLDSLTEEDLVSFRKPQEREVHFILMHLNCPKFESTEKIFDRAFTIVNKHEGMLLDILSGLVLAAVNIPKEKKYPKQVRLNIIKDLSKNLKKDIKIMHGSEYLKFGNYGSELRQNWSIYDISGTTISKR